LPGTGATPRLAGEIWATARLYTPGPVLTSPAWPNLIASETRPAEHDPMVAQKASCVVLGGGGFIGTNLCRRLVAAGHRVRAFGRRCLFPDDLPGVEWHQGNFAEPGSVAAGIQGFDIVFHLIHATMPQPANLDMAGDLQNNVVPSIALLDLCRRFAVKRVIFVSSGGTVYGCPQQIPTPETAPTLPICAYGISKLAIEKYLALYEYLHDLDYRVLRIANPFGPFQTTLKDQGVIAALIARGLNGKPIEIWGDGSVVRDFVFVDDVVEALRKAAMDHRGGERIFNIGSGKGRSLREVIRAIEDRLGTGLRIAWKPGRPIDVPVSVVAIDRAREGLDWVPTTSFESGLEQTIEWARRHLADPVISTGQSISAS
jgi:UDP-glucose 4-epimerase